MTAQRYHQHSQDAHDSCSLEDMTLLYHCRSGQTHMVVSPVPEILEALSDGAVLTVREVHDRLAELYDLGAPQDALPQIEAHLAELVALGLVRTA